MGKVKKFTFSIRRGRFYFGSNEEITAANFSLELEDGTKFSTGIHLDEDPDYLRSILEDDLIEGIKETFKLWHGGGRFDTRSKEREAFKIAFREHLNEIYEIHLRNMLEQTKIKYARMQDKIRVLESTGKNLERDIEWLRDEPYELDRLDLFPEVTTEGKIAKLKKSLDYYSSQKDKNLEKIKTLEENLHTLTSKANEDD